MPIHDYKYLLTESEATLGQTFTGDEYTVDEVNFGVANPNVGKGGKFGLHIIVTTAFTGAAEGIYVWLVHGADTAPTTPLIGRWFATASLTAGKHYFIPGGHTLLQYARGYVLKHTNVITGGRAVLYFGPDEDGAE